MKTVDKKVDEVLTLEFEFARVLETVWRPGTEYALNAAIRPTVPNGAQYKATTAGQSGSVEPVWPAIAATVTDGQGSLVWTGEALSSSASDTISTKSVTAPAALTLANDAISGTKVTVDVSAGLLDKDYAVSCKITTAGGETFEELVLVKIRRHSGC